jgi:hypothetical protein
LAPLKTAGGESIDFLKKCTGKGENNSEFFSIIHKNQEISTQSQTKPSTHHPRKYKDKETLKLMKKRPLTNKKTKTSRYFVSKFVLILTE